MPLSRTSMISPSCCPVAKWCAGCRLPPRPGMFVSHARVRIVGLGPKSKKRRFQRRRLAIKEVIRMPCLLPTIVTVFLGLAAVAGGAGMSVVGYIPSSDPPNSMPSEVSISQQPPRGNSSNNASVDTHKDLAFYMLKTCAYLGPLLMAVGMFAMIVSCVFYCEILDKYSILVPDKKSAIYTKDELYEIIVGEMKKSYAQTLITAYTKAAERSMMSDNKSASGDFLADPSTPFKPTEPLSLEQQIDIECEGYTPSPPIPNKRYSVIQARIQRLRSEDNWLKTSSLPNIRRSEHSASIKRVGRFRAAKKHSLSCDYTMDEARLRRKSMMLRSIILGQSSSSGDLHQKRTRRFSSAKFLPSENTMSLEEMSQFAGLTGSFPLTRLIQRRGTFACGDMRTRRMKFLLLLQASESKEKLSDTISMDGRASIAAIRRNSFIPYTTCDRFIAGEEKKHNKDRRTSVNPFTTANRFGNTAPNPGMRRHSFFPVRRDDKIYVNNPNEQRRHSYNPTFINNTLKSDYAAKVESRRGSFNPDGTHDGSRRESYVPPQKSNFLQVPGFETDPLLSERHPSAQDTPPATFKSAQSRSDSQFCGHKASNASLTLPQTVHDSRIVERRHSYHPAGQTSTSQSETVFKVPKIVISSDSSNRFLSATQEYYPDERRHSFNAPTTTKLQAFSSTAFPSSSRHIEKPIPQRISFKIVPENSSPSSPPHQSSLSFSGSHTSSSQATTSTKSKYYTNGSPSGSETSRPSSFKQEMIVFSPLNVTDSRSISPVSNVSCCGSERVGSERSARTGRTASISSERTTRTLTPVSVVVPDSMLRDESLERPPSPIDLQPVDYGDYKDEEEDDERQEHPGHRASLSVYSPTAVCVEPSHRVQRKSPLSNRDQRFWPSKTSVGRRHYPGIGPGYHVTDSPASTSSGPATLLPTSNIDANMSLHRSQSTSAISSTEEASDSSFISYANLSPSASTARPSVKDKTVRAKQRLTDDKS